MAKKEYRGRNITCKLCGFQFKYITEEERNLWALSKFKCPNCDQFYCNMPSTERQLHILQDEFFISDDQKILRSMYDILIQYGTSLFLKTFKNVSLHSDDIKYYVENAVSLFISEYYYEKNIKVTYSFAGLLIFKLKQALYGKTEICIDAISINYSFEDEHNIHYKDEKKYFDYIEREYDKDLLSKQIFSIIIEIGNYSDSVLENYLREQALLLHFSKGEKYADRFLKQYNREGKFIYLFTLDVLKNYLKKSLETS